jgi:hypothetical protein
LAYCYVNKQRSILLITTIPLNKPYTLQLTVNNGSYFFKVKAESGDKFESAGVAFTHKKKLQYILTPFFGGNRKAPHLMTIKLSKA